VTSSRRLLLHALFDEPGDRTAEELAGDIQAKAPDTNMSTIYRNLEELERLGVILHAHLAHGPATYHLASHAHGHLVCEECGATIEAPADVFNGLSRIAQSRYGFQIHPYHFAVTGRCQQCGNRSDQFDADSQPQVPAPPRHRNPGQPRRPPRPKREQARG
jgi:Fur family ferric uptake transcriptional regulator